MMCFRGWSPAEEQQEGHRSQELVHVSQPTRLSCHFPPGWDPSIPGTWNGLLEMGWDDDHGRAVGGSGGKERLVQPV